MTNMKITKSERLLAQFRYTNKELAEGRFEMRTESRVFDADEPISNIIDWYSNTWSIDYYKTNLEVHIIEDKVRPDIDDICEWLKENAYKYSFVDTSNNTTKAVCYENELINDLKKAYKASNSSISYFNDL